jgi:hypothetical protein
MARYLMRRRADSFAVISAATGSVAMVNGKLLDDLDEDEADDLVDLINCVEGESLLDVDDLPEPAAAVLRAPSPRAIDLSTLQLF